MLSFTLSTDKWFQARGSSLLGDSSLPVAPRVVTSCCGAPPFWDLSQVRSHLAPYVRSCVGWTMTDHQNLPQPSSTVKTCSFHWEMLKRAVGSNKEDHGFGWLADKEGLLKKKKMHMTAWTHGFSETDSWPKWHSWSWGLLQSCLSSKRQNGLCKFSLIIVQPLLPLKRQRTHEAPCSLMRKFLHLVFSSGISTLSLCCLFLSCCLAVAWCDACNLPPEKRDTFLLTAH